MSLHPAFLQHLQEKFTSFFGDQTDILNGKAVTGGDINQCFLIETTRGKFFMKVNAALFGLDFFEKEAKGLMTLADTGTLKIPRPLFDGKFQQQIYLVMEYLIPGPPSSGDWELFGKSVAALHGHSSSHFGLDYDNYIGRLHQENKPHRTWHDFYANQRIMVCAYKAGGRQLLSTTEIELAEQFCSKLTGLIPDEKPALLHGDLWNGNFLFLENGAPALVDPAVYYGHREMDLAMAKLFGGFDPGFFEAYDAAFPLEKGWQSRVDIFQLYPLFVHLLLFGGDYYGAVLTILKKYS